jgi:hypothetical protein
VHRVTLSTEPDHTISELNSYNALQSSQSTPEPVKAITSETKLDSKPKHEARDIITLDDDDNDDIAPVPVLQNHNASSDEAETDPEVSELLRAVRELRRMKEIKNSRQISEARVMSPEIVDFGTSGLSPPQELEFDPTIEILITCELQGAKPLLVQRKWTQRLQEVRKAFCTYNNLPPENIFLTWRNRKLFDSMNCKSLGIKVDSEGRPTLNSITEGVTRDGSRIQLEAVTQELWIENKRAAEQRIQNLYEPAVGTNNVIPKSLPKEEEETRIRLIFRAKGHEDWKAKVLCVSDSCTNQLLHLSHSWVTAYD